LVGVFQLECAAVKSSLQALRGKLKTRSVQTHAHGTLLLPPQKFGTTNSD
jgi:hypothetical protein